MAILSVVFLILSLFAGTVGAAAPTLAPSPLAQAHAEAYNRTLPPPSFYYRPRQSLRPFADFEKVAYVLFPNTNYFGSQTKPDLLKRLPPEVISVILVETAEEGVRMQAEWGDLRPPGALKPMIVPGSTSNGAFWARDSLPVPIVSENAGLLSLALVQARNWHGFEPGTRVGRYFSIDVADNPYYFEGGNFKVDTRGNCLLVNNERTEKIPDAIFLETYGCHHVVRLPFEEGIGHIDERVNLISDTVAFTDTPSYQASLEAVGYRVKLLPKAGGYRTYLNALAVNGTAFVPTFQTPADAMAIRAYRAQGFEVVPLDSREVSDNGFGSIHCMTMAYPDGTFNADPDHRGFLRFR